MAYRVGVIGLGIMGNRMLDRLKQHPGLEVTAGWDPSADAGKKAQAAHPKMAIEVSAEALCKRGDVDCIYIASPPNSHVKHAFLALDAKKAAFIEKPLATDLDEAQALVERVEREKAKVAMNFSLAYAPSLVKMEEIMRSGRFGRPTAAAIDVLFAEWPRPWQKGAAPWLAKRHEGGFTREVISHFVFALQRVLGAPEVVESKAAYPENDGAETALDARVIFGETPAAIHGRVGNTSITDLNVTMIEFERGAVRLVDWTSLDIREGDPSDRWEPSDERPEDLRQKGQVSQLDGLVAMLSGKPHRLATVAEGLIVQDCVEELLD
jgi:predicted dehydrogenase